MCTGILIKTKNNKYVFGRTLEFGIGTNWKQYCSKDIIGTLGNFNGTKMWYLIDGCNKYGLCIGGFFYPHYEKEFSTHDKKGMINLESPELIMYLLKNCKTINEVLFLVKKINIKLKTIQNVPLSLHWIVTDSKGLCYVLEVVNKKIKIYENKLGVITNSPSFPEQIKNQKKYNYLSKYTKPNSWSQGSGALGLPGDGTATSRFVRAYFYKKNAVVPTNGMNALLRILHNFDIPKGSVVDKQTGAKEVTEYTVVYNINDCKMKYANYGNVYRNGDWVPTDKPVKLCPNNLITKYISVFIFLLISVIIIKKFVF